MPETNPVEARVAGDRMPVGRTIVIKGDLEAAEDLVVDGLVDGTITLRAHTLAVAANGRVTGQVFAKAVVVMGAVIGDISAAERVEIRDSGTVEGDIVAPRVVIADGGHVRGRIDMPQAGTAVRPPVTAQPSGPAE